jgi:hypothetical protein
MQSPVEQHWTRQSTHISCSIEGKIAQKAARRQARVRPVPNRLKPPNLAIHIDWLKQAAFSIMFKRTTFMLFWRKQGQIAMALLSSDRQKCKESV